MHLEMNSEKDLPTTKSSKDSANPRPVISDAELNGYGPSGDGGSSVEGTGA